jgi:hypothetical protein
MVATSSTQGPIGRFKALPGKLKLAAVFTFAVVLFLSLTALLNAFNYSVGTRTGVLNRLSNKGLMCWTMEGQLALPNFAKSGNVGSRDETVDNTFYFSVPDRDVQKKIEAVPSGSRVTVEYHQKLFALDWPIPFFCVRKTQFEIVDVRLAPAQPADIQAPLRPSPP